MGFSSSGVNYNPQNLVVEEFANGWYVNGQRLERLAPEDTLDKGCTRTIFQNANFVLKVDGGYGWSRQARPQLECWQSVSQSPDREFFAELLACLKVYGQTVVVQRKYDLVSQELDIGNRALLERLEATWLLSDVSSDERSNYGVTLDGKLIIYDYQICD